MPYAILRTQFGVSSENDLTVELKDNTIEYLCTSPATSARVSGYLDRDWPQIENIYAELFIENCPFEMRISRVSPGSRTRTGIVLPAAMSQGEQLTLEVKRHPKK